MIIAMQNTNPWKLVANYMHQYDPYKHPQTGHMENTGRYHCIQLLLQGPARTFLVCGTMVPKKERTA